MVKCFRCDRIDNEILMTIRSTKKTKMEYSLQEPIGTDKEGNEINLLDILGTDGEEVLNEVDLRLQTKKLYKAIDKCLKDREKVIIQLRYGLIDGDCKTQREIAGLLGISRSYVSRIETRAIKKLLKEMNKK
ncbi:MAG: sigma-70 family RNA polymerase sigma factor [Tissierella sp.]|nr:sigma-70 family RNA polymerase sigma factor [Tissierella sp.]